MSRTTRFFCAIIGRTVRTSFCANACRRCSRFSAYDDSHAPSPGVVSASCGQPIPGASANGGKTGAGAPVARSFITAYEMFFGVEP